MNVTLVVAGDTLREALRRRWFLVLGIGVTLCLMIVLGTLRLDVVEGSLASTRLAASTSAGDLAAGRLFSPLFHAAANLIFYGGILFGIFSCAEFAPALLSPGRIEHLLALPVKRWQLIVGTFLGVWAIATCASLYAAGGLTVILGIKTGFWSIRPLLAALLSTVAWAAIYSTMLVSATLVRSPALSAGVGGLVFIGSIIASHREGILAFFAPGLGRSLFALTSMVFPRLTSLGAACAQIASFESVHAGALSSILAGFAAFTVVCVALAIVSLERQDF